MSDGPALELAGVSKRFREREALCGVDLVAHPGRLHGLLGPNGAGKTTLMRVLLGLVRRDAGTVRLLGRNLDDAGGRVPEGVAGLVETPAFYPYLSARRNLTLLARLDGQGTVSSDRIDEAIDQAGVTAFADVAVAQYSAGMRQRLGLAAALLRRPRLLILDEPTGSLDPAGARAARAIARRLTHEGTAVLLSSHDMAEVDDLCSTLTVINRGRVVFSGTTMDLRALAPATVHALRTSDDGAATGVAALCSGVRATPAAGGGLDVAAEVEALDAYVIALGRAGVAVRALERRTHSLESLFLRLTDDVETSTAPAPVPIQPRRAERNCQVTP